MAAGKKLKAGDRFDCPCCSGDGCEECGRRGKIALDDDPKVSGDIWELLAYCDAMDKGTPPISGGMLDQDRWFFDAWRFVTSEWERMKIEAWER